MRRESAPEWSKTIEQDTESVVTFALTHHAEAIIIQVADDVAFATT
jgi:hypothetical protein